MTDSQTYEFSDLDGIACNTEVNIQIPTPTQAIRLRTRVIGVDPQLSVILALGTDKNWQHATEFITQGQSVVIRIIKSDEPEATVLAFRSNITKLLNSAGRWLVIDYPKALQKVALRQHSRIPIKVESSMRAAPLKEGGESAEAKPLAHGHLTDISIKGGAFICKKTDRLIKDGNNLLQVKIMPEMETISIPVTIRNVLEVESDKTHNQYGFELDSPQSEAELFVQKVILNHLLQ
ncbi:flagellar brake protein [Shewanella sp. UCD-KL12]|uniref:flagellar brake protein n=1 Tax=Shewanella sp. UCD-KL12 TaxID=1917163 RepID=UPI000970A0CE|nr:PilZ domain-containing protein [Shewanella sp. UCD-KL12]